MSAGYDIDIGVVTWNTAELTVGALRRLLDTDQGCRFRLLVRDNGSTDGTAEAIRTGVPEAELDADDRNLGFGAGMNRLIQRGDSPWFLALNPDAWPEPGAVGALLRASFELTTTAAVAPRLERPDGSLEHSTHPFPSVRMALIHALGARHWMAPRQLEREMLEGFWDHDQRRRVDWAVGAALLMRRATLDEIGGFDPEYFMYAEDLDWCWRAHQAGWDVLFDPGAVFRHVGNASGVQAFGAARIELETASLLHFYRRAHGPAAARVYRSVSAVACAEQWAAARLRRDHPAAERWSREARAMARGKGSLRPTSVLSGGEPGVGLRAGDAGPEPGR
ncbi:MAG TPA: glycosyltransferase family 2 protein [Acidimicrobiales bacterium]|nr:glycosyltransferase family 2 protein [Acidimicrobiales bacterium]